MIIQPVVEWGHKVSDCVASITKLSVVLTDLGFQILNFLHVEVHKYLSYE
jgi:hypothetical protein